MTSREASAQQNIRAYANQIVVGTLRHLAVTGQSVAVGKVLRLEVSQGEHTVVLRRRVTQARLAAALKG